MNFNWKKLVICLVISLVSSISLAGARGAIIDIARAVPQDQYSCDELFQLVWAMTDRLHYPESSYYSGGGGLCGLNKETKQTVLSYQIVIEPRFVEAYEDFEHWLKEISQELFVGKKLEIRQISGSGRLNTNLSLWLHSDRKLDYRTKGLAYQEDAPEYELSSLRNFRDIVYYSSQLRSDGMGWSFKPGWFIIESMLLDSTRMKNRINFYASEGLDFDLMVKYKIEFPTVFYGTDHSAPSYSENFSAAGICIKPKFAYPHTQCNL